MWNYRFPGYSCILQIEPGRHVRPGGGKGPPEKNHPDIIGGGVGDLGALFDENDSNGGENRTMMKLKMNTKLSL